MPQTPTTPTRSHRLLPAAARAAPIVVGLMRTLEPRALASERSARAPSEATA